MRPCGSKPSGSEVRPGAIPTVPGSMPPRGVFPAASGRVHPGAIPTVPGSRRPRGVSRNTTSEDAVQAHTWGPEGRPEHCGLPFGLSLSPRTFTVSGPQLSEGCARLRLPR